MLFPVVFVVAFPEAAGAVQIALTRVAADGGVSITHAAPRQLFIILLIAVFIITALDL